MIGTLVNTGAIVAGSIVGILIRSRLPQKMVDIIFQTVGLFTGVLGISMALHPANMILVLVSIVLGAIIGQSIDVDRFLRRVAGYLQNKYSKSKLQAEGKQNSPARFTDGFITASILFCTGSMSILGPIEDGMGKVPNLLFTKSVLDGISSVALASSFGVSILFSSMPVFIYQGGITLFAAFIMQYMSEGMIADMTAVGGIMLLGLAINILKIKDITVVNMLPALVVVVVLSYFFG